MNTPWILLAGLLPLAFGPLLARWVQGHPTARGALDSFVAVALGGIVVLHLWPHAFLAAGLWAVLGGIAGLGVPFLFHGFLHAREDRAFAGLIGLAFLGLAVHAVLDGVALHPTDVEHAIEAPAAGPDLVEVVDADGHGEHLHDAEGESGLLALAVLLHRLPMALAIWWLVVPALGRRLAILILLTLGVGTLLGYGIAGRFLVGLSSPASAVFEATVGGMLLHVLFGHDRGPRASSETRRGRVLSALSALAGVALVWVLVDIHPLERLPGTDSAAQVFWHLSLTMAPLLLVGFPVAAWWVGSKSRFSAAFADGSLVAWLAAGPLLGWRWTGILVTWRLVRAWFAPSELLIDPKLNDPELNDPELNDPELNDPKLNDPKLIDRAPFLSRLEEVVTGGLPWWLLGLAVASVSSPLLALDLPGWAGYVIGLLVGLFLLPSPLLAIPVAWLFLSKGWPAGAVLLMLLVAGPVKEWRRQRSGSASNRWPAGRWLAWAAAACLLVIWPARHFEELPQGLIEASAWWRSASLVILAAAGLVLLFRGGFRGFVEPLFEGQSDHLHHPHVHPEREEPR